MAGFGVVGNFSSQRMAISWIPIETNNSGPSRLQCIDGKSVVVNAGHWCILFWSIESLHASADFAYVHVALRFHVHGRPKSVASSDCECVYALKTNPDREGACRNAVCLVVSL